MLLVGMVSGNPVLAANPMPQTEQTTSTVPLTTNKATDTLLPKEQNGEARKKRAQEIEMTVRAYFADEPVLVEVAKCESHFTHFDSTGEIHRGKVNDQDVGVMQINERYHLKESLDKGYDIYDLEGNLAYARNLFERQGLQPWISSSPCWKKSQAYREYVRIELAAK
jgi:hypothetical protein